MDLRRRGEQLRVATLVGLASLAACTDVPANPMYLDEVRPILMANCVRCHAAPQACTVRERAAFRLDTWESIGEVRGVAAMSERIIVRAADQGTMPPSSPLTDREREILKRWRRAGSPQGERDDDHPPWLTVLSSIPDVEPADQRVEVEYLVGDTEGDTVSWDLGWEREGVEGWLVRGLPAGHGHAIVDTGTLPTGSYELIARLTDGVGPPVTVPVGGPLGLPERDAAPSVRLVSPNGGERLTQGQEVEIAWTVDDADSPGALAAVLVLRGDDGGEQVLASGIDARLGAFLWSSASALGDGFELEIRVSDGTVGRSDRSDCHFSIAP